MANERRGPKMFLDPEHRRLFGKSSKVIWLTDTTQPGVLAAAHLQHVVSLAVHTALTDTGQTIDQLAASTTGLGNADTLRRKLRGEVWMSLSDMTTLEVALPSVHTARRHAPLRPG